MVVSQLRKLFSELNAVMVILRDVGGMVAKAEIHSMPCVDSRFRGKDCLEPIVISYAGRDGAILQDFGMINRCLYRM